MSEIAAAKRGPSEEAVPSDGGIERPLTAMW
jgi:hypothetical protein